jgi:hypothetical protein
MSSAVVGKSRSRSRLSERLSDLIQLLLEPGAGEISLHFGLIDPWLEEQRTDVGQILQRPRNPETPGTR